MRWILAERSLENDDFPRRLRYLVDYIFLTVYTYRAWQYTWLRGYHLLRTLILALQRDDAEGNISGRVWKR